MNLRTKFAPKLRTARRRRAELAIEAVEPRLMMTAGLGFIGGYSTYAGGAPDTAATIQLYGTGSTSPIATTTPSAPDGYFHFDGLASGTYTVSESEAGYASTAAGATTTINPATAINNNTAFQVTVVDPSTQSVTITNGAPLYAPATTYYTVANAPFNSLTSQGDTTHQYNLSLAGNQGNTHTIVSLCTDVYHGIGAGAVYPTTPSLTPQDTNPDITPTTSATNLGRIGYLYNHLGQFSTNDPVAGAGLQLAIWELLYDTTDDLTSGNFQLVPGATAPAIVAAANADLAASVGKDEDAYFLNVGQPSGSVTGQSMICTDLLHFTETAAPPVTIAGNVYHDVDASGSLTAADSPIPGVLLTLTNAAGTTVATTTTAADGSYHFTATAAGAPLVAGTYKVSETQPAGYLQGTNTVGTVAGTPDGTLVPTDMIASIVLAPGQSSVGNNFGEVLAPGAALARGQSATIGFWHNKNGQALIDSFNGGPDATALGHWLAGSFPNLYGNLAGQTNAQVAGDFLTLFNQSGAKVGAQVLAAALAVYATDSDLAGGTMAVSYGFTVNSSGTGISTIDVGNTLVAAYGPTAPQGRVSIYQLLAFADRSSSKNVLGSGNATLLNLFNTIFDGINQGGDIS